LTLHVFSIILYILNACTLCLTIIMSSEPLSTLPYLNFFSSSATELAPSPS